MYMLKEKAKHHIKEVFKLFMGPCNTFSVTTVMILKPGYPLCVSSCLQGVELCVLPQTDLSYSEWWVEKGRSGVQQKITVDWREGLSGKQEGGNRA